MWLKSLFCFFVLALCVYSTKADNFYDHRCTCLCPYLSVVNGTNQSNRLFYNGNPPRSKCNCEGFVLPQLGDALKGKEQEFCLRCQCRYENRNTTIIKAVVIIVIWVISLLCVYMLFLMCLDPLLNKRVNGNYQEHTNEDEENLPSPSSHAMRVRSNVLNRVGHQQDKWKKQVREQRKNIYDKHTMLN